jgi:putative transposon-encoded protein
MNIIMAQFEINGVEAIEKDVTAQGNGAHVLVPKSWRGSTVKVVRMNEPQCQVCGRHESDVSEWTWFDESGGVSFEICQDCIYRLAEYEGNGCVICHEDRQGKKSEGIAPTGDKWSVRACDECRSATLFGERSTSNRIAWDPDERRG